MNNRQDVWVAGAGVICGIGSDLAACVESFRTMQTGVSHMQILQSAHRNEFPVVEVKVDNEGLAVAAGLDAGLNRTAPDLKKTAGGKPAGLNKTVPGLNRTALLSSIAARQAWESTGLGDIRQFRVGFVSANTVGGMDLTEDFFADYLANNNAGRLRQVLHHECGSITEQVADALGIRHHITTISTACSSGANALMYGARLIRNNVVDIVIAGGADALTRFTLNGFNTLMLLDRQASRPFDDTRTGLNLGEGAGYVVLVKESLTDLLPQAPWCKLSGFANANDAYHQTASSPDGNGSYMAMQGALEMSGLEPDDIDYINLHGTGTPNNDASEGTAIMRLFTPMHFPPMSSTKSFTGHTLGASGGIEAAFSALAVKEGYIYPNANFSVQMKELPFSPVTEFSDNNKIRHVMSNSFGFGGNCSSLIFSTVDI
jgi:3-oxoacyl-[acyl-carrier-protein] synthase I